MTRILIVDDSPVDRRLVGELLAGPQGQKLQDAVSSAGDNGDDRADDQPGGCPGLQVKFAVDGEEALQFLAQQLPDLVITDLLMPELNGLQLVAAIRSQYPRVPVILMTSRGSEDIAVQALQQGAASYVPKRFLMRDLTPTMETVLKASAEQKGQSRLISCMVRSESAFKLDNDPALFDPLTRYLQEETVRMGVCNDADRVRVGVALTEALTNALYHGNLGLTSDERDADPAAFYESFKRRRHEAPYGQRRIQVEASISRSEATITIRDEGTGFNPDEVPDPTDPENFDKASGRGIMLMRAFMDDVNYNDTGNSVVMVKRRK